MSSKIYSAATVGLDAQIVEVEADYGGGGESGITVVVGLPDTAVKESKERVWAAIKNSGLLVPRFHTTVNLAPADLRKEGPAYDLPIALSIISAAGQLNLDEENSQAFYLGELSLDGSLRPINGILPIAILARKKGIKKIFVPKRNATEASLVAGVEVMPTETLSDLIFHFRGVKTIEPFKSKGIPDFEDDSVFEIDMAYVKGQEHAKRALEIAASAGHNVLLSGPPGSGKTLLSRAMTTILPKMTYDEILEVTKIYSVSGKLPKDKPLVTKRPFRSPHHTSSGAALVGGGAFPRPGEISLAHKGVLFLDEFPEFPRQVLENLRQPLEDGVVTVSRAQGTITFPARFTLIASQNPCLCGYASDPEKECTCSQVQILKYQKRISGPLLDRIDLHVEVPRVKFEKLNSDIKGESSNEIRQRVERARQKQRERFKSLKISTNAEMGPKEIKEFCKVNQESQQILKQAVDHLHLSARGFHRVLKVARTIADLSDSNSIESSHIAEALQYRTRVE